MHVLPHPRCRENCENGLRIWSSWHCFRNHYPNPATALIKLIICPLVPDFRSIKRDNSEIEQNISAAARMANYSCFAKYLCQCWHNTYYVSVMSSRSYRCCVRQRRAGRMCGVRTCTYNIVSANLFGDITGNYTWLFASSERNRTFELLHDLLRTN